MPKTRRIFIVLSLGCICSYWACRLRLRRSRSRSCRTSEARHALSCQLRFRNLPLDLTRIGGVRNRSKPGEVACIHSFIHSNSVLANIGMRLQESILVGRRLRSGPVRAGAQVFSMVLRVELSSASISFSKSSSLDDSLSPVRYSRISFFFCSGVPLSSTSSSSSELPQKKKNTSASSVQPWLERVSTDNGKNCEQQFNFWPETGRAAMWRDDGWQPIQGDVRTRSSSKEINESVRRFTA